MGYLFVSNATQIPLSFRIYILLICMWTFTILCNMLCCRTQILHTYVIKSFRRSGKNLLPRSIHTYISHPQSYLKYGSRWFLLIKLWKNIVLSIPYKFGLKLRSFYGPRDLVILVINISKILTNILDPQISATLILKYLINAPLASNLRCPKLHLATGPLVLPHKHIKVLIDFAFSGMTSDDSDQKTIYEGINGETCWILITYNFTGMKHGYERISKASNIYWLRHFLNHDSPTFNDKCIHLDQGGELFNKPDVKNLLQ